MNNPWRLTPKSPAEPGAGLGTGIGPQFGIINFVPE